MNNALTTADEAGLSLNHLSATICAELAAGLSTQEGICEKYEIPPERWEVLKESRVFRNMLKDAITEWSGDLNAGKRITKKAEIMLEDSMHRLYKIAHDDEKPAQAILDAIEKMAKLAGRNDRASKDGAGQAAGAQINIIIDTGGDQPEKTVTIDAQALEAD